MVQVSVVIPVHNGARYVGGAIQSVLQQSYQDFEIVVVDDGSTDDTRKVVERFVDPHLRYIYQQNAGPSAARNLGIRNSSGKYLAFLDADDEYLPDKLEIQTEFLTNHPDIALVYNPRYEMDEAGNNKCITTPPLKPTLHLLLIAFPFGTCDILVQREAMLSVGFFNEALWWGEDPDLYLRLFLNGAEMIGASYRPLARRRLYARRVVRDTERMLEMSLKPLQSFYEDDRCPPEASSWRDHAFASRYLGCACQEYAQGDVKLARAHLNEAIARHPDLMERGGRKLIWTVISHATRSGPYHEEILATFYSNLPHSISSLGIPLETAVGYGYLICAIQEYQWQHNSYALRHLDEAISRHVTWAEEISQYLVRQALALEAYEGEAQAQQFLTRVIEDVIGAGLARSKTSREVRGLYWLNRGFRANQIGNLSSAWRYILQAFYCDPRWLRNRGAISTLLRGLFHSMAGKNERSRGQAI